MKRYGPNLRADSLSNIPLNSRNTSVCWRFVATRNEPLIGLRLTSPIRAGYTAGNGGDIYVKVYGSGVVYDGFLFQNATDPYAITYFTPGASLTVGAAYWIEVRNVADDPINNWRSVDGLFVNQVDANDARSSVMLSGFPHPTNQPMWEVLYASTIDVEKTPMSQGVGYVDVPNGAAVLLPAARQSFTPAAPLQVVSGAISLRGLNSPGTVSLAGQTAVLFPPTIPNGWSQFYFQNLVVLPAGFQQYLQPFGSAMAVPLQKGWNRASDGITKLYTYAPQTFFGDGNAQQLVNGVWQDWLSEQGAADPRMDLMFYLEVL